MQDVFLFHQGLADGGIDAAYIEVPNKDHFNLIEELRKADYSLTKVNATYSYYVSVFQI